MAPSLHLSQLVQMLLLALGVGIGYLAGRWSGAHDTIPLSQICGHVDYVDSLRVELRQQQAVTREMGAAFDALVEQCRAVAGDRVDRKG
jgi:hypothetical protein